MRTNKNMIYLFFIYLFFLQFQFAFQDLPVHCRKEQIAGHYIFRIEQASFDADLNNPKTSCGHGFPDRIENTQNDINFSFDKYTDMDITLNNDYQILENGKNVGNWTAVYDEGFIVYYKGSVFTAFMKYFKKRENYFSNCDKTMIGWYVKDTNFSNKSWSCFFGFKVNLKNEFSALNNTALLQVNKFLPINQISPVTPANLFTRNHVKKMDALENKIINCVSYDAQSDFVEEINNSHLQWTAGITDEFKGLSFEQLRQKLGLRKKIFENYAEQDVNLKHTDNIKLSENGSKNLQNSFLQLNNKIKFKTANTIQIRFKTKKSNNNKSSKNSKDVSDFAEISKYFDTEIADIDMNDLPTTWDWRDVGGTNYVPAPQRQGGCGSCYIFSLITSLESRLRVSTNNQDQTLFSKQFPLACSFYTEGCEGGYPIFVAKFSSEFELIPESCMPYNPNQVSCSNYCDYSKFPKKYAVTRYEYLGGYYGATSEAAIMKEIRARGPVPGNMAVPWTFMYYKSGIYNQIGLKHNSGSLSKTTLLDKKLSWVNVEHSILLIGWGEEEGIKYWIGMNTWGDHWGENGYFRILRGENECNIETMGDAARIGVSSRAS